MLREAWDGEPIHVVNRKANALSSTDYTVSVVGDITPGVIRKTLETGTGSLRRIRQSLALGLREIAQGFAQRG